MKKLMTLTILAALPSFAFAWSLFGNSDCATKADTSIPKGVEVQRQEVTLLRTSQRVVRYTCEGKIKSNKVEDVVKPIQAVELTSVGKFKSTDIQKVKMYNRMTCEDEGILNSFGNGITKAIVDSYVESFPETNVPRSISTSLKINADSDSYMYVLTNQENFIDYEFQKCGDLKTYSDGSKKCKQILPVETGVLVLTVKYQESKLEGVMEIRPPQAECDKD